MNVLFSSAIRKHAEPIGMKCIDGIERFLAHIAGVNKATVTECPVTIRDDANPTQTLGDFFQFLHYQYVAKFVELCSNMVLAANRADYLVFALCGRSIIESTATLRYYNKHCNKRIETAASAQDQDTTLYAEALLALHVVIDQHLRGGRFNWYEFFTGDKKSFTSKLVEAQRNRKGADQPNPEAFPISRMLDSWAKDEPYLHLAYNFFSDLVHPNLGSNLLLMGVDSGRLLIGGDTKKSVGLLLCLEGVKLVAPSLKEASTQLAKSLLLSRLGKPLTD